MGSGKYGNIRSITDLEGYRKEFFQLFGFEQITN
ncbi:hypothetical protein [Thermoactinomyces sp. CICC 10523]